MNVRALQLAGGNVSAKYLVVIFNIRTETLILTDLKTVLISFGLFTFSNITRCLTQYVSTIYIGLYKLGLFVFSKGCLQNTGMYETSIVVTHKIIMRAVEDI